MVTGTCWQTEVARVPLNSIIIAKKEPRITYLDGLSLYKRIFSVHGPLPLFLGIKDILACDGGR